ncbi:MAG: putative signal transducing protein [Pyrinomonadaceae bacterium]
MFCPVCESEYEEGIATCPDDATALVERLTPENTLHDHSEARFVPLHNIGSPAEAEMVFDILSQNGIRVAVQSGGSDMFAPLLSTTAPGALVLVDERDYDRATEVYNSFFGSDTTPLTGTTDEEAMAAAEDDDEGEPTGPLSESR